MRRAFGPLTEHVELGWLAPLYAVAKSLTDVYNTLRHNGSTLEILDRLMPFNEFNGIVGLEEKYALDAKYGKS